MTNLKDIYVNTNEFEFSHGKLPRGEGCWAFQVGDDIYWSAPNSRYGEAVRDAKKYASLMDQFEVKVLP